MNYFDQSRASMGGIGSSQLPSRSPVTARYLAPKTAPAPITAPMSYQDQSRASMMGVGSGRDTATRNAMGRGYMPSSGYAAPEPYVAPTPIVGALRATSLNPNGIRRNSNTFKGTRTAAAAPTGKVNPSGVDRSARVSATTNE